MKKFYFKVFIYILLLPLAVFIFVYGGADDSPGAQLLGLIIFLIGVIGLIKSYKK